MSRSVSPYLSLRSTDGDYLPVLGDVWRDVPLDRMAENADTRGIERVNYLARWHSALSIFSALSCLSTSARTCKNHH